MDSFTWLALGLILLVIVLVITAIAFLHMIPGKIARANNHPQAKAIEICSLMGLIIFPFWMIAYVWANYRPANIFIPEKPSNQQDDLSELPSVEPVLKKEEEQN
jgi:uncharacterized membrane protein